MQQNIRTMAKEGIYITSFSEDCSLPYNPTNHSFKEKKFDKEHGSNTFTSFATLTFTPQHYRTGGYGHREPFASSLPIPPPVFPTPPLPPPPCRRHQQHSTRSRAKTGLRFPHLPRGPCIPQRKLMPQRDNPHFHDLGLQLHQRHHGRGPLHSPALHVPRKR